MKSEKDEFDDLPSAFVEKLKSSERQVPLITARVDRKVLRMARQQFAARRPLWRRTPAWAAAAALVMAILVVPLQFAPDDRAPAGLSRPADISDVLQMARAHANEPDAQAEIDAFAMRIVSLDRSRNGS